LTTEKYCINRSFRAYKHPEALLPLQICAFYIWNTLLSVCPVAVLVSTEDMQNGGPIVNLRALMGPPFFVSLRENELLFIIVFII